MKVIDLYSGLGGFSQAFKDRGHKVFTIDINPKFKPDLIKDIIDLKLNDIPPYQWERNCKDFPYRPDIIIASPPCKCFSVASIGKHWSKDGDIYLPKTIEAFNAVKLVKHTIDIIEATTNKWWILENPRGMLRKIIGNPEAVVTWCQYGANRMKPTDLWGNIPKYFIPKKCKNGDPCHERAPRGSKTGTQGIKTREERAKIPYGLSEAICLACEKELK